MILCGLLVLSVTVLPNWSVMVIDVGVGIDVGVDVDFCVCVCVIVGADADVGVVLSVDCEQAVSAPASRAAPSKTTPIFLKMLLIVLL